MSGPIRSPAERAKARTSNSLAVWARILLVGVLLTAPPVLGAWLADHSVRDYLRFPPQPVFVRMPPFSVAVFIGLLTGVAVVVMPFVLRVLTCMARATRTRAGRFAFPWWGWAGLALVAASWVVAWSRFPALAAIQGHTFIPLWIGFVLTINAVAQWRLGASLLTSRPGLLLALFPASAGFWWLFEYLNGFVGNWHYVTANDFGPGQYTLYATLSFSTVLPAVLSTTWYFARVPAIRDACEGLPAIRFSNPKPVAAATLTAATIALAGLAIWPQYLFALVWIAPGLSIVCVQSLADAETGFEPLARGDWRPLWAPALASLACGLLWELWNSASLAHWEYTIPYVDRFHLFEMPALGYAGYLPFGIECLAAAALVFSLLDKRASVRWIVGDAESSTNARH